VTALLIVQHKKRSFESKDVIFLTHWVLLVSHTRMQLHLICNLTTQIQSVFKNTILVPTEVWMCILSLVNSATQRKLTKRGCFQLQKRNYGTQGVQDFFFSDLKACAGTNTQWTRKPCLRCDISINTSVNISISSLNWEWHKHKKKYIVSIFSCLKPIVGSFSDIQR